MDKFNEDEQKLQKVFEPTKEDLDNLVDECLNMFIKEKKKRAKLRR